MHAHRMRARMYVDVRMHTQFVCVRMCTRVRPPVLHARSACAVLALCLLSPCLCVHSLLAHCSLLVGGEVKIIQDELHPLPLVTSDCSVSQIHKIQQLYARSTVQMCKVNSSVRKGTVQIVSLNSPNCG